MPDHGKATAIKESENSENHLRNPRKDRIRPTPAETKNERPSILRFRPHQFHLCRVIGTSRVVLRIGEYRHLKMLSVGTDLQDQDGVGGASVPNGQRAIRHRAVLPRAVAGEGALAPIVIWRLEITPCFNPGFALLSGDGETRETLLRSGHHPEAVERVHVCLRKGEEEEEKEEGEEVFHGIGVGKVIMKGNPRYLSTNIMSVIISCFR